MFAKTVKKSLTLFSTLRRRALPLGGSLRTMSVAILCTMSAGSAAWGGTIASWTFETSQPLTAGPFSPEVGAGSAKGSHVGASVYSTPAGNGSAHSFSSNTWAVGDYYQFQVNATGMQDLQVSWDQTGSSTGPADFTFQYSTNGTTFTNFNDFSVQVNGTPNTPWSSAGSRQSLFTFNQDLTSVLSLNNQASVFFRVSMRDTVALNAGTVAAAGTDRVDNFTVVANTIPAPEPSSILLAGLGMMTLALAAIRRRSKVQS